jgi:hypothetical protein
MHYRISYEKNTYTMSSITSYGLSSITLGIGRLSAKKVPMTGRDVAQQPHLTCSSNCSKKKEKTHLTAAPRQLSATTVTMLSTAPPSPIVPLR